MSERRYHVVSTFDRFWLVVDTWTDICVAKYVIKANAETDALQRNASHEADSHE